MSLSVEPEAGDLPPFQRDEEGDRGGRDDRRDQEVGAVRRLSQPRETHAKVAAQTPTNTDTSGATSTVMNAANRRVGDTRSV